MLVEEAVNEVISKADVKYITQMIISSENISTGNDRAV